MMSLITHEKSRLPVLKYEEEITKNHDLREQKNALVAKKTQFYQKKVINNGLNQSMDMPPPLLMTPVILLASSHLGQPSTH